MFNYKKYYETLTAEADPTQAEFAAKFIPDAGKMLGIKTDVVRKTAKEISKDDWREFLLQNHDDSHEEIILQGFVIAYAKMEAEERLKWIDFYIQKIKNWASCDCFCCSLKFTKKNKALVWDYLQNYLHSDKEFEIRFGVVMLLAYYIDEEYIDRVFDELDKISHEAYYVKMAVAWAVSYCLIKQMPKTLEWFKYCKLDDWTFNKGIQKARESYRIDKDTKEMLNSLKRKKS